jgi:hypothetical protein
MGRFGMRARILAAIAALLAVTACAQAGHSSRDDTQNVEHPDRGMREGGGMM